MTASRNAFVFKTWMKWVSENLKEFVREGKGKDPLRITGIIKDHQSGKIMLEVKPSLIGNPYRKTPESIINDNQLIQCFSRNDIRGIAYLAYHNEAVPECSIVSHIVHPEGEDEFVVKFNQENTSKKLSLTQLINDKAILGKMNGIDGCKIGFMTGVKSMLKEMSYRVMKK